MALTWKNFNADNIIFETVKKCESSGISFQRIFLKYDYKEGNPPSKISIRTPDLFSWGVQENGKNVKAPVSTTNPVENYSMSLVMFNKENPSDDEMKTIEMFETILSKCQDHLRLKSTKDSLGKYKLDGLIDIMKVFYRKEEKGELVPGFAPTLYPKLYTEYEKIRQSGQKPKIVSGFYEPNHSVIDPTTLVGVKCRVVCEIIVDHIYVGANVSLQIKLNDAIVTHRFQSRNPLRLFEKSDEPIKSVFDEIDQQSKPEITMVKRKFPS